MLFLVEANDSYAGEVLDLLWNEHKFLCRVERFTDGEELSVISARVIYSGDAPEVSATKPLRFVKLDTSKTTEENMQALYERFCLLDRPAPAGPDRPFVDRI